MLIVGSKALSKRFPILNRETKDTDIIGSFSDYESLKEILKPESVKENEYIVSLINITPSDKYPEISTKNVEILLSDNSTSLKMYLEHDNAFDGIHMASPEVLFSLKKSHIHFPIKFGKHINDYNVLYKYFNGEDKLNNITKINFKETETRIGKLRTPSLKKSLKEFFGQSEGFVISYFIHDDMHRAVAHYDAPLYENMQYDKSMVTCHKELWDKFTFEDKCKCVLEETTVIALERKILPMIFGKGKYISSEEALKWALMRVCTTLCSGWFREFATNNYYDIWEFRNKSYVEDFLLKYQEGKIKRI